MAKKSGGETRLDQIGQGLVSNINLSIERDEKVKAAQEASAPVKTEPGRESIRSGESRTSPRCGRGCTYAAFERATLLAQKMATELGVGWEPWVFENLGWHYAARRRDMDATLHTRYLGEEPYWASIITSEGQLGSHTQFYGHGATPTEALVDAVLKAARTANEIRKMIEALAENEDQDAAGT